LQRKKRIRTVALALTGRPSRPRAGSKDRAWRQARAASPKPSPGGDSPRTDADTTRPEGSMTAARVTVPLSATAARGKKPRHGSAPRRGGWVRSEAGVIPSPVPAGRGDGGEGA